MKYAIIFLFAFIIQSCQLFDMFRSMASTEDECSDYPDYDKDEQFSTETIRWDFIDTVDYLTTETKSNYRWLTTIELTGELDALMDSIGGRMRNLEDGILLSDIAISDYIQCGDLEIYEYQNYKIIPMQTNRLKRPYYIELMKEGENFRATGKCLLLYHKPG